MDIDYTALADEDLTGLQQGAGAEQNRRLALASLPDAMESLIRQYAEYGGGLDELKARTDGVFAELSSGE